MRKSACFLLLFLLVSCGKEAYEGPDFVEHELISYEELSKGGINFVQWESMQLLIDDGIFIISRKDHTLAKFSESGQAEQRYTAEGQGPGEFQSPLNVFHFDEQHVAVFDAGKDAVLIFDRNLRFRREIQLVKRIGSEFSIRKLIAHNGVKVAFGDFGSNYLATLDKEFKLKSTFREIPTRIPFERGVFRGSLYMAYLNCDDKVAATTWGFYEQDCAVDIIDPVTEKVTVSLTWKNPRLRTQKDIDMRRNSYSSTGVEYAGGIFAVANQYVEGEVFKSPYLYELIFFDAKGTLMKVMDTDYQLLQAEKEDSQRFYLLSPEENLVTWTPKENSQ